MRAPVSETPGRRRRPARLGRLEQRARGSATPLPPTAQQPPRAGNALRHGPSLARGAAPAREKVHRSSSRKYFVNVAVAGGAAGGSARRPPQPQNFTSNRSLVRKPLHPRPSRSQPPAGDGLSLWVVVSAGAPQAGCLARNGMLGCTDPPITQSASPTPRRAPRLAGHSRHGRWSCSQPLAPGCSKPSNGTPVSKRTASPSPSWFGHHHFHKPSPANGGYITWSPTGGGRCRYRARRPPTPTRISVSAERTFQLALAFRPVQAARCKGQRSRCGRARSLKGHRNRGTRVTSNRRNRRHAHRWARDSRDRGRRGATSRHRRHRVAEWVAPPLGRGGLQWAGPRTAAASAFSPTCTVQP